MENEKSELEQVIKKVRIETLKRRTSVKFRERTDAKRDHRIPLRVSEKEKQFLIQQAKKRGITVSAFILLKALRGLQT